MNLYQRDYRKLNKKEEEDWHSLKAKECVGKLGRIPVTKSLFREYPKAARHYISIFPNNYLDVVELKEEERLQRLIKGFEALLNSNKINERAACNFINENQAFFIVASILESYYHFGHHETYLFREFQLGISLKVDYLIVGKGSGGWEFVFVELESPSGNITLKGGDLGSSFRKGEKQVEDWDRWLEAHFPSLKETFDKHKKDGFVLPEEFTILDKSRIHYVIVAGRRSDFQDKTYRISRKKLRDEKCLILHYDNLLDSSRRIIGAETY